MRKSEPWIGRTSDKVLSAAADGGHYRWLESEHRWSRRAGCICGNRAGDAPQPVGWSPDGRSFYVSLVGGQKVYAVPLRPEQVLPSLPQGGIRSPEDIDKLPGAKLLPAPGEFPGPSPSLYAFPKFTSQRNIYRVPIP